MQLWAFPCLLIFEMEAIIKDKKEIATGTLWVKFDLNGKKISFKAGQFFYITLLKPPYRDLHGNERHFSFINSPKESDVIEMATRIRESAFKKSLFEIPLGSKVKIGAIAGRFYLPEDIARPIVFITGGIGITPFISMIRFIKDRGLPYKITLIYSNRNKKSTAFLDELKKAEKENPNFKLILTMTDDPAWSYEKRVIDSEFIKEYIPDISGNIYMLSGPPKMVYNIRKALKAAGVRKKDIREENFSGY